MAKFQQIWDLRHEYFISLFSKLLEIDNLICKVMIKSKKTEIFKTSISYAYKAELFKFDILATKLQHSSLLVNTHIENKAST